jgi:hypothetical protein
MTAAPKATTNVATVREVFGETGVYEVRSRTKTSPDGTPFYYRVEVTAQKGCGQCGCERWSCVSWPHIKACGSLPPSKRCFHLRAAREAFLNKVIAHLPPSE